MKVLCLKTWLNLGIFDMAVCDRSTQVTSENTQQSTRQQFSDNIAFTHVFVQFFSLYLSIFFLLLNHHFAYMDCSVPYIIFPPLTPNKWYQHEWACKHTDMSGNPSKVYDPFYSLCINICFTFYARFFWFFFLLITSLFFSEESALGWMVCQLLLLRLTNVNAAMHRE